MKVLPQRKKNRLEYDYSQNGGYFVTICAIDKKRLFGEIIGGDESVGANSVRPQMKISRIGEIVEEAICKISEVYEDVFVDIYAIMPNHIHLILMIDRSRRCNLCECNSFEERANNGRLQYQVQHLMKKRRLSKGHVLKLV